MMKRVLIIGASSAMAQATAKILSEAGVFVIGISRSDVTSGYNEVYQVTSYTDALPVLEGSSKLYLLPIQADALEPYLPP